MYHVEKRPRLGLKTKHKDRPKECDPSFYKELYEADAIVASPFNVFRDCIAVS